MMVVADPTLKVERAFYKAGTRYVIGCDEVGRGALAGPVAVGMVVLDASARRMPKGLRDSKMLSEPRREELAPVCQAWVLHAAIGLASADEVDRLGIIACLGLAGSRALASIIAAGAELAEATILLDGQHDYLSPALGTPVAVATRVKADRDCASVAAASVLAKVHRDRLMIDHDPVYPGYGWRENKGYGSPAHLAAIAELGATDWHRRSWLKSASAPAQPA